MLQKEVAEPLKSWLNDTVFSLFAILLTTIYSAHRIALYDYSFMANIGHRLTIGEIPYRDFDLPLPIGSFLPIFVLDQIPGIDNLNAVYISSCLTVGISTFTALRILRLLQKHHPLTKTSIVLLNTCKIGLVFVNVISHSPNYFYDSLSSTFVLLTILFSLKFLESAKVQYLYLVGWTLGGAFISKYNVGAALGLAICIWIIITTQSSLGSKKDAIEKIMIISLPSVMLLFGSVLFSPGDYFYQTVFAPGENKKVLSASQLAQYNYGLLIIMLFIGLIGLFVPIIQRYMHNVVTFILACALLLLVTNRVFSLTSLNNLLEDIFPNTGFLFPVAILMSFFLMIHKANAITGYQRIVILLSCASMLGSFLSQGWNGSSYAFYPELIALLFSNSFIRSGSSTTLNKTNFSTLIVIFLLIVNATLMIFNGDRLGFLVDNGARSNTLNFNVIGTALSTSDIQAIRKVQHSIEKSGASGTIAEFPSEDPISLFSTNLKPWFRCIQYTLICPTVSESELEKEFRKSAPDIVILKHQPQINFRVEPFFDKVEKLSKRCFKEILSDEIYSVYKKVESTKICMDSKIGIR